MILLRLRDFREKGPKILLQISHAQPTSQGLPNAPAPSAQTPKCFPETATVYFLPAPPSSPKITILDPKPKDITAIGIQNVQDKTLNIFKEPVSAPNFPPPIEISTRVALPPPPPSPTGLPDLIDDIPAKVKDRISRLAESGEKPPVCETCAALIKKLPIFTSDRELLDGFLAGIGI